jgi:NTE family protein
MYPNEMSSLLDTPALGTADKDLIRPCDEQGPQWTKPPNPPKSPTLALALSGGGFRATLSGLGVLRFLADAGLLSQVRYSSSVSGGSIANGLFAKTWPQLGKNSFAKTQLDSLVIEPVVERISRNSLKGKLIRNAWKTVGPKTRTEVLADVLDDWFFHNTRLEELPRDCRFIINAANLTTGVRFGFERDVIGDYVLGNVSSKGSNFRLALAIAASAAVPGAFAPVKLKGFEFPCALGRIPLLVDGGAYDNSGLEPVDDLEGDVCLVALNAGGLFLTGYTGKIPIIRDLKRTNRFSIGKAQRYAGK